MRRKFKKQNIVLIFTIGLSLFFFLDKSPVSARCSVDSDCGSGEICKPGPMGSECEAKKCSSDSDCGAGYSCSPSSYSGMICEKKIQCTADSDCGIGERCKPGPMGSECTVISCTKDTDCGVGSFCIPGPMGGECGVAPPATKPDTSITDLEEDLNARKPILQINIPGLNFSDIASTTDGTGTYFYIPWLSQFLTAIYKFGIAMTSILAVVIIIMQGARIIVSGGGEGKQAAYKKILQSVIGLAIAWGSFAILYNINPELVQFKALKVKVVEREELENNHQCDDPNKCGYKTNVSSEMIPKGNFTSNLELAKKDRTATVDYKYFGQVDYSVSEVRKLQDIKRFVIHNGGYTAQMNVDVWLGLFKEKKEKTGTHYTIDRNGIIYQMIGEEAKAVHAGIFNGDSIGVELNISNFNGTSCNGLDSGPAEAVRQACTPTEAQYQALKSLIDDVIKRTSVKLDKNNIVGHCESSPKAHGDPRAFDWEKIGLNNQDKKHIISSGKTACSWYLPF